MKNNAILFVAVIAAFIFGVGIQYKVSLLSENHEHTEQAEPLHEEEGAHGHGHGDGKSSQMTVYDDQIEVFLEHPFLVAGKGAEFVTHVSYMRSGLPITEGPITFVIQQGQEKPIEHIENAPARDGIYIPTLTFPKPGSWKLALVVSDDTEKHRIDLQDVAVYATQQKADAAPEQEGPEGISFLKEEQWKWRTLTEFARQINIDGSRSLAIPESCVVYDRNTAFVYVQVSGETVQKRQITLGQARDGMISVESGLHAGERVISRSAYVIAQKEQTETATDHSPHGEEPAGTIFIADQVADKHQIISSSANSANLKLKLRLNGQIALNADKVAHIVPVVSGVVREVNRNVGDKVQKGDVLAWIESRELADTKAAYLAACERLDMAKLAFEREESLWKNKISSEQEYLNQKHAFTEARIDKRTLEQKLNAIGFNKSYLESLSAEPEQGLTKYELKAPCNGTILAKHLTLGESIPSDRDVFVIADMDTVWADFQVHAKDASEIRAGQKVLVKSEAAPQEFECILSYVLPVVDQNTRTFLARAILPNEAGRHRPGQFISGTVFLDNLTVQMAVMKDAVQYVDDIPCVFVKVSGGYEKRPVELGHSTGELVEIIAGINPTEEVVVKNAFLVKSEAEKTADTSGGHGHAH